MTSIYCNAKHEGEIVSKVYIGNVKGRRSKDYLNEEVKLSTAGYSTPTVCFIRSFIDSQDKTRQIRFLNMDKQPLINFRDNLQKTSWQAQQSYLTKVFKPCLWRHEEEGEAFWGCWGVLGTSSAPGPGVLETFTPERAANFPRSTWTAPCLPLPGHPWSRSAFPVLFKGDIFIQ